MSARVFIWITLLVMGFVFGILLQRGCTPTLNCDECIVKQDTIWKKKYLNVMDSIRSVQIDIAALTTAALAAGGYIHVDSIPGADVTVEIKYDLDTVYLDTSGVQVTDSVVAIIDSPKTYTIQYTDSLLSAQHRIQTTFRGLKSFDWDYQIKPLEVNIPQVETTVGTKKLHNSLMLGLSVGTLSDEDDLVKEIELYLEGRLRLKNLYFDYAKGLLHDNHTFGTGISINF